MPTIPDLNFASRFTGGQPNPAVFNEFGTRKRAGGTQAGSASMVPLIGTAAITAIDGTSPNQPTFDEFTMTAPGVGLNLDGVITGGEPTIESWVVGFQVKINTVYEPIFGTGRAAADIGLQILQSPSGLIVRPGGNPTQTGIAVALPAGFTDGDFMWLGVGVDGTNVYVQPSFGPRVTTPKVRTVNPSNRLYIGARNTWNAPYSGATPRYCGLACWPGTLLSEANMRQFINDVWARSFALGFVCE